MLRCAVCRGHKIVCACPPAPLPSLSPSLSCPPPSWDHETKKRRAPCVCARRWLSRELQKKNACPHNKQTPRGKTKSHSGKYRESTACVRVCVCDGGLYTVETTIKSNNARPFTTSKRTPRGGAQPTYIGQTETDICFETNQRRIYIITVLQYDIYQRMKHPSPQETGGIPCGRHHHALGFCLQKQQTAVSEILFGGGREFRVS